MSCLRYIARGLVFAACCATVACGSSEVDSFVYVEPSEEQLFEIEFFAWPTGTVPGMTRAELVIFHQCTAGFDGGTGN